MPFLAWRDVDPAVLAKLAETNLKFPGVDVYVEPVRVYPDGEMASHLLGYVGRADPEQSEEEPFHFYLPEMEGKWGVELAMNDTLAGIPGGRLVCVDASGYKRRDTKLLESERGRRLGDRPPRPGRDVFLTVDAGIQRIAEQVMTNSAGALVVMNPQNGDVLALVSSPGFDPNRISLGLSKEEWDQIRLAEHNPMFDRAISGTYAPGSVFKPVVVLAALQSNKAGEGTVFECHGYYQLGNKTIDCWIRKQSGRHGAIAMRKAIEQSCNAYFCQLGLLCGNERIYDMGNEIGFGRKTGIDLRMESAGLLPNEAWKKKVFHDAWRKGDTCNLSIGQGALAVTPIQVAVLASAIANGGNIYRPRLVKGADESCELVKKLNWPSQWLRILRGGMYDVVQADSGTGKRARIPDVEMAGKTGTAEFGPPGSRKKNAWMMAYAPFEKPRYAMVLLVEEGISGGITVAPRIKELAQGIFALERSAAISPAINAASCGRWSKA